MTYEEFQEKVKAIPDKELSEMADKELSKWCKTGGKSFTMTVPPRIDDTDVVLSEVVSRFAELQSQNAELLEGLREFIDPLTGVVYDHVAHLIGNESASKIEQLIEKHSK